ncbi:MAG: hypothetical protein A2V88_00630 [Elusimicrobia bacterium RBG_16_66_12]|nr:MAG: hypothetical protein A2V88_00630 [Elusimicrobia bacterium RBG_16_66_12]
METITISGELNQVTLHVSVKDVSEPTDVYRRFERGGNGLTIDLLQLVGEHVDQVLLKRMLGRRAC